MSFVRLDPSGLPKLTIQIDEWKSGCSGEALREDSFTSACTTDDEHSIPDLVHERLLSNDGLRNFKYRLQLPCRRHDVGARRRRDSDTNSGL